MGLGMHEVTCDKCGKACEVPFKPTGNKPVYCSDCFRKNEERPSSRRFDSGSSSGISSADLDAIHEKLDTNAEEMEAIHEKLDKIMQALNVEQD
jgi:CxxC-x17-CxxC domain-containing protein